MNYDIQFFYGTILYFEQHKFRKIKTGRTPPMEYVPLGNKAPNFPKFTPFAVYQKNSLQNILGNVLKTNYHLILAD